MLEDVLGTYKKEIAELESYLLLNGKIYLNVHICIMKISYASGMQQRFSTIVMVLLLFSPTSSYLQRNRR